MTKLGNVTSSHDVNINNQNSDIGSSKNEKGYTRHELFKDTSTTPKKTERTLFQSLIPTSWLGSEDADGKVETTSKRSADFNADATKPISSTPLLERPNGFVDQGVTYPPFNSDHKPSGVSEEKLMHGLSLMSSHTMEQVVAIVMKEQLEMERERAITTQDGFTKLNDFQKIHQRSIEAIKDALAKDEKVAGYFQTAQTFTRYASFVCGVAAIAVMAGITLPAAVVTAATYGTFAAAAFGGAATCGEFYTEVKMGERQGDLTKSAHEQKQFGDSIDHHSEMMASIADSDANFKEQLVAILKNRQKTAKAILQK